MNGTRRLLMVGVVAAGLAADRAGAAVPVLRPQVAQAARKLAGRLVISLRRTVPAMPLKVFRRDDRGVGPSKLAVLPPRLWIHPAQFSPFYFRLPPPLL